MQRFLWTALLALPLCVQPAEAQFFCCQGCGPTVCSQCPFPCLCNIVACVRSESQPREPWYLGFPPEISFLTPGTSFVPVLPLTGNISLGSIPTVPVARQAQGQMQPATFQPVSYTYPAVAPSYWYGR
jgi:hypothetical protein